MANLSRPKRNGEPVKAGWEIAREHERRCESPLEQQGHNEHWDADLNKYVKDPKPEVGHIEVCEHGWVVHVTRVNSYYSNSVETLQPGSLKYRKAKRIIRRERRAKVLEERRAGRAETA